MSNVLGIDLSSKAIDLVLLDENTNAALWERRELDGGSAFERACDVRAKMPAPSWFASRDVYLIGIEIPESRYRSSLRAQLPVVGAVLACLPRDVAVWPVAPADWKRPLGIGTQTKPTLEQLPDFTTPRGTSLARNWPQDARDALGVAFYVRDTNAAGIERALREAAA